jgi:hypothetical protein
MSSLLVKRAILTKSIDTSSVRVWLIRKLYQTSHVGAASKGYRVSNIKAAAHFFFALTSYGRIKSFSWQRNLVIHEISIGC